MQVETLGVTRSLRLADAYAMRPRLSRGNAIHAEVDLWLAADAPKVLELQRPLPDHALKSVVCAEKDDACPRLIEFQGAIVE